MQLPPEDRELSPYTGWTRAHWEAAADRLLAAVHPHASPGRALINLPGTRPSWSGRRSDGLEGYARTFLLAAFRVAGAGGADPHGLLERYAAGLDAGTRTPTAERDLADGDTESWGRIEDRSQPMVEAASVAVALRLTRPWLWDRLDDGVRERAGRWLADALRRQPHDNNWWLFPLSVGGFLAEAGIETDAARAAVDRGLDAIEQWYLGDGWYTDGRPRALDHYNGWALHLYPVLHAWAGKDAGLLERYGARLAEHLEGYARLFDRSGAPVHQGRSLSYRFAAAAPLWAGALADRTPLSPGATRRLASGALRYFLDRGAVGADGLLTLGWHGPYPPLVQPYSGPASPYWASKGFLGLLLPAEHPVWTAVEEPGPSERADAVTALPTAGWLIQSTAADGLVRLHNHGSDDQLAAGSAPEPAPDDPLYAPLAHSTRTGPTDGDNRFALLLDGTPTGRGRITPLGAGPGWAASAHHPRPGTTVTSLTLARGADELRVHLVTGAPADTPVRASGWAAAGSRVAAEAEGPHARVRAVPVPAAGSAPSDTSDAPLLSEVHGLRGFAGAAVTDVPAGTAYGPAAAVPELHGTVGDGLSVAAVRLTAAEQPFTPPAVTAEPSGSAWQVTVHWPDGGTHRAELATAAVTVRAD
ncbi:DUF2264 domain-containing protein [Kitasatospora terrestris]|uniref:DUF2264 domain-containing protein n=1 Tax=Kitasatospora terrestris TaxID=258051 RepID=A0ABP9DHA3_9ACTN